MPSSNAHPATAEPAAPVRRRRGQVLEDAILRAACDQLREVGYSRLTMDGVAFTAGTGKAALYRRWSSKDELVTSALRSMLPDPGEVPLTGDARRDLLALLGCVRDTVDLSQGTAFQAVKSEAGPALINMLVTGSVTEPCLDRIRQVLARGAAEGTMRPEAADPRLADVGEALMMHRLMMHNARITDEFLEWIVDGVMLPLVMATEAAGRR
jgi:AcrR family transcriptional regulator